MEPFFGEGQFDRVCALLRRERKIHTKEREVVRRFLEAACWMGRSGAQRRFLPAAYGKWNSVYARFARWDELGVWARLFAGVADDPALQSVMLDATVVRAPARRAPPNRGRAGGAGARARAAASAPSATSSSTRWATR